MTHSFHRGALVLDFIGTLGLRGSAEPKERIPKPTDLGSWLQESALLASFATITPQLHRRAIEFREATSRVLTALVDGRVPVRADVQRINDVAAWARFGADQLDLRYLTAYRISTNAAKDALGRIATDAVRAAAEERQRLTRCELDSCGCLLLSRSRSEKRRWCSMQTCGNVAKASAFRRRRRSAQG